MTETIKTLLQPIQNRLNAAIPGPWEPMRAGLLGTRVVSIDGEWEGIIPPEFIKMVTPAMRNFDTAVFIAAAPTDQARLLAAVQAVANECGEVVADSAGLGLDFQEDDFDRGYHAARRQTVQQIVDVVVAALSEAR